MTDSRRIGFVRRLVPPALGLCAFWRPDGFASLPRVRKFLSITTRRPSASSFIFGLVSPLCSTKGVLYDAIRDALLRRRFTDRGESSGRPN